MLSPTQTPASELNPRSAPSSPLLARYSAEMDLNSDNEVTRMYVDGETNRPSRSIEVGEDAPMSAAAAAAAATLPSALVLRFHSVAPSPSDPPHPIRLPCRPGRHDRFSGDEAPASTQPVVTQDANWSDLASTLVASESFHSSSDSDFDYSDAEFKSKAFPNFDGKKSLSAERARFLHARRERRRRRNSSRLGSLDDNYENSGARGVRFDEEVTTLGESSRESRRRAVGIRTPKSALKKRKRDSSESLYGQGWALQ